MHTCISCVQHVSTPLDKNSLSDRTRVQALEMAAVDNAAAAGEESDEEEPLDVGQIPAELMVRVVETGLWWWLQGFSRRLHVRMHIV